MFKWMPHKEQDMCEKKLKTIMKRLKIEDFTYNWDRSSCFIEFQYQGNSYRLEHSLDKAKEKGIVMLRNGLDCLSELVQSLEDLCKITERGTYKLENWLSSMKRSASVEEIPEYLEEVHIRYKPLGVPKHPPFNRNEEFVPVAPESGDFDESPIIRRSQGK